MAEVTVCIECGNDDPVEGLGLCSDCLEGWQEPTHWLNYRGDQRHMNNPVGPRTDGQVLYPVDALYDPEESTTRVGFSLVGPAS